MKNAAKKTGNVIKAGGAVAAQKMSNASKYLTATLGPMGPYLPAATVLALIVGGGIWASRRASLQRVVTPRPRNSSHWNDLGYGEFPFPRAVHRVFMSSGELPLDGLSKMFTNQKDFEYFQKYFVPVAEARLSRQDREKANKAIRQIVKQTNYDPSSIEVLRRRLSLYDVLNDPKKLAKLAVNTDGEDRSLQWVKTYARARGIANLK